MTLRGVIQGLMRGADDPESDSAEAMLADQGFGDLPAEMFGQALASYADTAPMAEADALTPVLASLESGDPSDVFAVLDEHPLVVESDAGAGLAGASLLGASALDDASVGDADLDGEDLGAFGESVVDADFDESSAGHDADEHADDDADADGDADTGPLDSTDLGDADPFSPAADLSEADDDGVDASDSFEDLFETEPQATGDDPADLDLDF